MHIGFSGIHFSRKGGDLAILSVQRANKECQNKLTLHMVGEGPMTPQWKKLAGGDPHIHWHGGLPHQQANAIISQCHVFLFPSLLDCNPTVICEALEAGLPIITTDLPGVGDMITAQCGYRLPTTSREFLIEGAKNALIRLHTNPDHLTQLTNGALAQRSKFSFGKTMATLDNIYHTCLQPNPKRTMPDEDS
jgi:glycosyltransferase involved in cell wall biosynthesis